MDFLEELKKIAGQDAKSQIRNETSKFNVDEQRVERDLVERGFDYILGRGEAIQEEAAKKYVKDLTSVAEQGLAGISDDPQADLGITSKTKRPELLTGIKDFKTNVANVTTYEQLGTGTLDRATFMALSPKEQQEKIQEAGRIKKKVDYDTDPAMQELLRQGEVKEAREARLEKEGNRRYDLTEKRDLADRVDAREATLMELQFRQQQEANKMSMFDKKLASHQKLAQREKMAGIISGLANLGAAFAI